MSSRFVGGRMSASRGILRVVGGPPRVGKSAIARTVARRNGIGWTSVDVLRAVLLVDGVSFSPYRDIQGAVKEAEAFFPYLRQFAWQSNAIHGDHCLEGCWLMPAQLSALRDEGLPIRGCFVGNESITPENLLVHAANFDWVRDLGDDGRAALCAQIQTLSRFVAQHAREHGWPYFDLGRDFLGSVEEVAAFLGDDSTA